MTLLRRSGRDVHLINTAAARPRLAVDNVREFTAGGAEPRNLKGTPPYDYPRTN
jgi:hypothetical protein